MNRRAVLASVGSALLAGCLSESTPRGTDSTPPKTTEIGVPTSTAKSTSTTDASNPNLRIPGENHCPDFGHRVVCYQNADSDANLLMEPSKKRAKLPKDAISFTLRNETGATFGYGPYHWTVWKQFNDEWFRIAPRLMPDLGAMLDSGSSHTWNLTVDNADLGRTLDRAQGTESVTLAGLGGGTYAFGISGWFEGQKYDDKTGVATRFELVGDSLELTPTADLEVVGEEGNEKHVRASRADVTYLATRIENPEGDGVRKIPEQVIRVTPLRNLLASFEDGVRRVRLDGREFAFGEVPQSVEYEGTTYRIEIVEE